MTIIENPYISQYIDNPKRIMRRLRWGKLVIGIFVVRQADEPDQLEIIRSEYFRQKNLHDEDKPIVAFFKSYMEAMEYVVDITQKSYDTYGFPYLMKYIEEYQNDTVLNKSPDEVSAHVNGEPDKSSDNLSES